MDQEKKLEELEVVGKEQDEIETEEEDEVLPDWFDGKHFFDVLFCQEYLAEHPMVCVGGEFFTKEGKGMDETAVVKPFSGTLIRHANEFGLSHDNHILNCNGKRVNGFRGVEALISPASL